jgi:hypothetical protein
MIRNIIIGKPLVEPWKLCAHDERDFEETEARETLFTDERFLPAVLVEAGIVLSRGEVRRNKPELCVSLDKLDCFWVKWGKKQVWVVVGE